MILKDESSGSPLGELEGCKALSSIHVVQMRHSFLYKMSNDYL